VIHTITLTKEETVVFNSGVLPAIDELFYKLRHRGRLAKAITPGIEVKYVTVDGKPVEPGLPPKRT
jgi:hypothetical protein